jgi:hypothetical protein
MMSPDAPLRLAKSNHGIRWEIYVRRLLPHQFPRSTFSECLEVCTGARVPQVREPGFCELTWEIDVRLSLSHQHSKI